MLASVVARCTTLGGALLTPPLFGKVVLARMTSPRTSYLRPLVALVALVAAMAALLIAYNASPTYAAPVCSTTAGTTTCTYVSTGEEQTFVVPEGVSSVHVVATGAPGAVGENSRLCITETERFEHR